MDTLLMNIFNKINNKFNTKIYFNEKNQLLIENIFFLQFFKQFHDFSQILSHTSPAQTKIFLITKLC